LWYALKIWFGELHTSLFDLVPVGTLSLLMDSFATMEVKEC